MALVYCLVFGLYCFGDLVVFGGLFVLLVVLTRCWFGLWFGCVSDWCGCLLLVVCVYCCVLFIDELWVGFCFADGFVCLLFVWGVGVLVFVVQIITVAWFGFVFVVMVGFGVVVFVYGVGGCCLVV